MSNVWQKPLEYCKVISLQLIKINENKKQKQNPLGWALPGSPVAENLPAKAWDAGSALGVGIFHMPWGS